MVALSPSEAAEIADHVYGIRKRSETRTALKLFGTLTVSDSFAMRDDSRFEGSSGPVILNSRSGFGYIAKGKGRRKGEALIVLRGTAVSLVNPWDIWTDLNIGMQKGPSGWPVHAGFNDTFKSIADQLHKFFVRNNPTHVHCVGHSLGGALATLIADYLSEIRSGAVSIYTFGCPRVGNVGFARNLTRRIKATNIYRVYHSADPVSMIPIFPFFHTPNPGQDVPLEWETSRMDGKAHRMENYTRSIGQSGWDGLMRRSDSMTASNRSVKSWLESTSTDGAFMYSSKTLSMIGRALEWIISRAKMITGIVITANFTAILSP